MRRTIQLVTTVKKAARPRPMMGERKMKRTG